PAPGAAADRAGTAAEEAAAGAVRSGAGQGDPGWLARLSGTAPERFFDGAGDGAVVGGAGDAGAVGAATGAVRVTPAAPGGAAMPWMNRRMLCIVLLLLAVVLGANFWVGIIQNTFNDLSSAVGVPQHDFFQY